MEASKLLLKFFKPTFQKRISRSSGERIFPLLIFTYQRENGTEVFTAKQISDTAAKVRLPTYEHSWASAPRKLTPASAFQHPEF
jgi:hypothetical protein